MYRKEIDFNSLTITDDFVFCTAMRRNKDLCMEFIRRILGIRVKDIAYVGSQETMNESFTGKGIRLDVFVEDGENSVYDLEMQTTADRWLPKRSRYYQSVIDLNSTVKGTVYRDLKKSFVVFICMSDPFTEGRSIYHFEKRCVEVPELKLGDETETVFVNAKGTREGISTDLANLLDYIAKREKKDEFIRDLDRKIVKIVTDQDWRNDYMTLEMKLQDKLEQGREEGREQGRAEGRAEGREQGRAEGRAEGREQGRAEGRKKGREEGRMESDCLTVYLFSHGLAEEVFKAAKDPAYKAELMRKYQAEL